MNTKMLRLGLIMAAMTALAPAARSQDMTARMVSWFTGDPGVLEGPSDTGPKNYAEDTCCGDGTCGCCSACARTYDTWGSVEFLMWWGKGTSLPPLVTTSLPGTPIVDAGVLGPSSTSILFGDQLAANKLQGGGRVTAGIWLDPDHNVAAGGRFFGLGGDTTRFDSGFSNGSTILGLPFNDISLNPPNVIPNAFVVAFPNRFFGSVQAQATTNNILGAEGFTEIMMSRDCCRRIDLVLGYQFFRLNDWLQIDSRATNVLVPGGLTLDLRDRFVTRNEFHGGEIGMRARMARGQWSLNVLGTASIGNMNQQVTIDGRTVVVGTGATTAGGILAQPTNIGTFERNRFAFLPQLTTNLHYHMTPNVSVHIGYNIMWMSDVVLTGDQIDLTVNTSQFAGGPLIGTARPAFTFRDTDYWLQGINWGVNWDF
jgi:hypothetical protein